MKLTFIIPRNVGPQFSYSHAQEGSACGGNEAIHTLHCRHRTTARRLAFIHLLLYWQIRYYFTEHCFWSSKETIPKTYYSACTTHCWIMTAAFTKSRQLSLAPAYKVNTQDEFIGAAGTGKTVRVQFVSINMATNWRVQFSVQLAFCPAECGFCNFIKKPGNKSDHIYFCWHAKAFNFCCNLVI